MTNHIILHSFIQVEIPCSQLVDQLNIPFQVEVIARISNLNDQMQLKLALARLGRHSTHAILSFFVFTEELRHKPH